MIRMILAWAILSVAIGAGVHFWRQATGKEKWQLSKTIAYAIMCSLVAVTLLTAFVILF
jgi:hypothetical protein